MNTDVIYTDMNKKLLSLNLLLFTSKTPLIDIEGEDS